MEPRDPVSEMAERLARVSPRLDDVTRQRVLVRLQAQLANERASAGGWPRLAWLLAVGVCAAAVGFALVLPRAALPMPRAALPAPARVKHAAAVVSAPPPQLQPYLVAGTDAERATEWLSQGQVELELEPGQRVHAWLGAARLLLLGPARLKLSRASAEHNELELTHGTLVGDYDHARGGRLTVRAPGISSEIVGTLFLVQAAAGAGRVAVAHGAVRVQSAGRDLHVGEGQQAHAGATTVSALTSDDRATLEAHARSFVSPQEAAAGIVGIRGAQLHAELGGKALGETPLWVKMPAGAHTITLHGGGAGPEELRTTVRAGQEVDLLLMPPRAAATPSARAARGRVTPAPVATPTPSDAATLYGDAEAAMRAHDLEAAAQRLAQLVEEQPSSSLVDLALYELAELATRRADHARAHVWLVRLEQHGARPALREPAAYLRCRNARAREGDASYAACLDTFLALYPDSARSAELRRALSDLRPEKSDRDL